MEISTSAGGAGREPAGEVSTRAWRSHVRGLDDLGNTCFFNSTLQCLASIPTVLGHFGRPAAQGVKEGPLTSAFRRAVTAIARPDASSFDPAELFNFVVKAAPRFKGHRQQDAQELLRYLLDAMQEEELKIRRAAAAVAAAKVLPPPPAAVAAGTTPAGSGSASPSVLVADDCDGSGGDVVGGGGAVTPPDAATQPAPLGRNESTDSQLSMAAAGSLALSSVPSISDADGADGGGSDGDGDDYVSDDATEDEGDPADGGIGLTPARRAAADAITRLFGGTLCSVVMCLTCRTPSLVTEPFLDVSIPIPGMQYAHQPASHRHHKRAANVVRSWAADAGGSGKRKGKKGRHYGGGRSSAAAAPASSSGATAAAVSTPTTRKAEKAKAKLAAAAQEQAALKAQLTMEDVCPAVTEDWLTSSSKTALIEWLQKHGTATVLDKLKIKKNVPASKQNVKTVEKKHLIGAIRIMQNLREARLQVLAKLQPPAPATEESASKDATPDAAAAVATDTAVTNANNLAGVDGSSSGAGSGASSADSTGYASATTVAEPDAACASVPPLAAADTDSDKIASVADATPAASTAAVCEGVVDNTVQAHAHTAAADIVSTEQSTSQSAATPEALTDGSGDGAPPSSPAAAPASSGEPSLKSGGELLGLRFPAPPPPLDPTSTTCDVAACLTLFSSVSQLTKEGGNGYFCGTCVDAAQAAALGAACDDSSASGSAEAEIPLRDAECRLLLVGNALPPVLTVHLKRFAVTAFGSLHKVDRRVEFPELLDVAPYCAVEAGSGKAAQSVKYRLCGVVVHSGSIGGGHYVAYVRYGGGAGAGAGGGGQRWAYISDSHTTESSLEAAKAAQAYLLFYERVGTSSDAEEVTVAAETAACSTS